MIKENKKGITLLALVITIVIMLLLAGVALQMAIGENGLISKAAQAKSLQEKVELYDTAKLEYVNMKSVTLENGQQHPIVEDVLLSPGFLRKYDVVGDNITDKKGKVIDTKENLINAIKGNDIAQAGQSPQPTIPAPIPLPSSSFPKNIAGVTILEEQKNEMIIKVNNEVNIFVDKNLISEALRGLIDNCIKYSIGNIELIAREDEVVEIIVRNYGERIPEEEKKNLFNRNFQGKNAKKGAGLGLSIIRDIILLNDGEIYLENRKDGVDVRMEFKKVEIEE